MKTSSRFVGSTKSFHGPQSTGICVKTEGYGFIEFEISNSFQQYSANLIGCWASPRSVPGMGGGIPRAEVGSEGIPYLGGQFSNWLCFDCVSSVCSPCQCPVSYVKNQSHKSTPKFCTPSRDKIRQAGQALDRAHDLGERPGSRPCGAMFSCSTERDTHTHIHTKRSISASKDTTSPAPCAGGWCLQPSCRRRRAASGAVALVARPAHQ